MARDDGRVGSIWMLCGDVQFLGGCELAGLQHAKKPALDVHNPIPAAEIPSGNLGAFPAPCVVLIAGRDRYLCFCRQPMQCSVAGNRGEVQQLLVRHAIPSWVEERENFEMNEMPENSGSLSAASEASPTEPSASISA